jgi:hypothetical protein
MSEYMKVIVCDGMFHFNFFPYEDILEEFHTLTTQEEKDDALNIYRQKLQKVCFGLSYLI